MTNHSKFSGMTVDDWLKSERCRLVYGSCNTAGCLRRGGHTGGIPDFNKATCPAYEALKELDYLRNFIMGLDIT